MPDNDRRRPSSADALRTFAGRVSSKASRVAGAARKDVGQWLRTVASGRPDKHVVFIAGVQRSGTNMMMQAFERSHETVVYREADPRAYERYELRPRPVLRELVAAARAPHVVFKALCELQELRDLLDDFAPARAVWMLRDLDDCVNSHVAQWATTPGWLAKLVADRESAVWRGRRMSDATHALVRKLYHPDIGQSSANALFWYLRNVLFFEQRLEADERVLIAAYEPLVTDPARRLREIFQFLGIEFTPAIAAKVSASSVRKRAAPEIEPAIRQVCMELRARFDEILGARGSTAATAPTVSR